MTEFQPNDEITTVGEFDAALKQLLLTALDNDVEIWGAWEYRNPEMPYDLEAMIVELEQN